MGLALHYWQLLQLGSEGQHMPVEIASARELFQQTFPDAIAGDNSVDDANVQSQLLESFLASIIMRTAIAELCTQALIPLQISKHFQAAMMARVAMPELCLRCLISHQILWTCQQLAAQFGNHHGFTYRELLPLVLDDAGQQPATEPLPLTLEILLSFDPERGKLATWAAQRVKTHPPLNRFLLEQGVYRVSDWAILNDTKLQQLPRILGEFHELSDREIEQASWWLESYHDVYLADRLKKRQAGIRGRCAAPTPDQLTEMGRLYQEKAGKMPVPETPAPEVVLRQLQKLAERLRGYRIYARGGPPPRNFRDRGQEKDIASPTPEPNEEESEFLQRYASLFQQCLDAALVEVTQARYSKLKQRDALKAEHFIQGLILFHCRGQAMGTIASELGLKAQYQVTRLLKLGDFRTDVRQNLLARLLSQVLALAHRYHPTELQDLEAQVEEALSAEVDALIEEAATQGHNPNTQTRFARSLLAQRLCDYLESRSCES